MLLRRAKESDSQIFFELRTFPKYQKYFYSQNRITFDQHIKWFRARIKSEQHIYMVAQLEEDCIGCVRFEPICYPNSFEIGFILHPDFLGRGLSSEMLGKAISLLDFEVGGLKPLIFASVLQGNYASLRALDKVGFLPATSDDLTLFGKNLSDCTSSVVLSFRY